MKKLMMMAILVTSVTMIAQRGPREDNDRMGKDLTAEQMATLQTKKMTLGLALDEGQSNKVYAVLLKGAQERKAQMERRKSQEERPELTKEQRLTRKNEMLDKRIALQREMKSILTEEQFAKFQKTTERRGKQRGKDHQEKKRKSPKGLK